MRAVCTRPWAIAGDFNIIYRAVDKNNTNADNRAMMGRFRHLLNDLELCEVELLGHRYTWSNERSDPTLVRLDRIIYTKDWEDMFPHCLLQSMAAGISDHYSLLLGLSTYVPGKRRFQFEVFWLTPWLL